MLAGAAEPSKVAPLNTSGHRLELENDRIVGFRVRLTAGEALPPHVHSGPVLLISVTGGTVRLVGESGGQRTWQTAPGDFLWFEHDGPGAIANSSGARRSRPSSSSGARSGAPAPTRAVGVRLSAAAPRS